MSVAGRALSKTNKARLQRVVGDRAVVHWPTLAQLPIDPALLATSERLSLATHYRVFLPGLLPATCHRVLYLDADVIVRGDLNALWETDMQDYVVMAVRDPAIFTVASPMGLMKYEALGIPPDAPYFNGGVLLVDVDRWRTERMTERFLDFSTTYGQYARWGDQDGLNAILHGRWGRLAERWNVQTFVVEGGAIRTSPDQERYVAGLRAGQDRLTAGAYIMHYTQGRKPWHPWCKHPYRDLFHHHFRRSGCFHTDAGYAAWYALSHGTWVYKKLTTYRTWKKIWKRMSGKP
jgi:lipopolysaccharide biosynthesis glycosyltransferase